MTDPITDLWATQRRDAGAPDPAALAAAELAFRRHVGRRDRREYAAGALVAILFAAIALFAPNWGVRAGAGLIIAGVAVVLLNLHRRRPAVPDPADGQPSRAFVRAQLAAQHEALAGVWRWYLLPLVPGLALFVLATAWPSLAHQPPVRMILLAALDLLPFALIFGVIQWLNLAGARRLQQRIDALDHEPR